MNGDALELMQKLGEIHADLKEDIGSVKTEMAGFKGSISSNLEATNFRVTAIERAAADDKFWDRVKTIIVLPVVFAIHKVLTTLGMRI